MSTKSYYLYIKQFSHDGQTWIDVQPLTYSYDGDGTMTPVVKEEHDAACGAMPPIYQWVDTQDTICVETEHDYSQDYLTFVAQTDGLTVRLLFADSNVFQYSTDSGATWNSIANSGTTSSVNSGQTIMFKASGLTPNAFNGIGNLVPSAASKVQGNIMSLIYGDNFMGQTTLTTDNTFLGLFSDCTGLTSAENLILPATTLTEFCYDSMFKGCYNLTVAPELPATSLTTQCYASMFWGCESLTTAPVLSATTLAQHCYADMFYDCISLTSASELPATTLTYGCYSHMFYGCTSLTTAPVLSATTLAERCCEMMFLGCTSLTAAPVLYATTMKSQCYDYMFSGCTNLNYVKCLAQQTSWPYTTSWVDGVASTGTFVKDANTTWPSGVNGIPNNWTIQNA